MTRTLTVVFDGEVFRPTEPVELPAGTEYRVTLEPRAEAGAGPPESVRRILERSTDLGLPADLAAQHDHDLHGSPKRCGRVKRSPIPGIG